MEHWNNRRKSSTEAYIEDRRDPRYTMADLLNERYLEYVRDELGIPGNSLNGLTIKERLSEVKPMAEEAGLQTQEIYTKNEKNKLKKILKFFLGEDGLRLLRVDENKDTSGYLISVFEVRLLEVLLDVLGTSNPHEIDKKFDEDKDLKEMIYKGLCTWANNKTNNLTKEFVDKRWCILYNDRFEKAMDALENLRNTLFIEADIAPDLDCNIQFWDYVREQIEMADENIKSKKNTIVRSSPITYKRQEYFSEALKKGIKNKRPKKGEQG